MKEMKQFKILFWDLDGTLTDPKEGITNSILYALEKFGITGETQDSLLPFIGPPLLESFMGKYNFSEQQGREAISYYREYFSEKGMFENKLYPGMKELLEKTKEEGYLHVMATAKPEVFAKKIAKHFEIDSYFTHICGADLEGNRRHKSQVIGYALEQLKEVSKDSILMIGDRSHDVEGAAEHGIKTLGVGYGYGGEEELRVSGAWAIALTLNDLYSYFQ